MTCVEYVSLGNWCITSHILKLANLKKKSYPFDWIFSSNEMICRFIENPTLFQESNLLFEKGKTHHKIYGDIFNHHDPLVSTQDYQYFQRCVKSFVELKSKKHICFITISNNTDYKCLYDKLSQHFTNFTLVTIDKQHGHQHVVCENHAINWKCFTIYTDNLWNGENWDAHIDNDNVIIVDILKHLYVNENLLL